MKPESLLLLVLCALVTIVAAWNKDGMLIPTFPCALGVSFSFPPIRD